MALTDIATEPWNTTFEPFIKLFEQMAGVGAMFYLVPLTFLAIALYARTRDVAMVSAYLIFIGVLFSGVGFIGSSPEMTYIFMIFTAIGLLGLFIHIFFLKNT